jgi:ubiquinone/menaquinone biosynthesis C-methylase UbiE
MKSDLEYYKYQKNRNNVLVWLRRHLFIKPIKKELQGKVLDVGCGLGEFLLVYKHSIGVEINPYSVKHCKTKGLSVRKVDGSKLPFKKESFNGILCSHVFEHLDKPEGYLREMRRVLKKKGKLVMIVPCKKGFAKDKTHKRFWKESNLKKILKKNKFIISKVFYLPVKNKKIANMLSVGELIVIGVKK